MTMDREKLVRESITGDQLFPKTRRFRVQVREFEDGKPPHEWICDVGQTGDVDSWSWREMVKMVLLSAHTQADRIDRK